MLSDFNQGYCTFWWDGNWAKCCEVHDIAYGSGTDKLLADIELGLCVINTGNLWMGIVMFLGVSIFGWFFYKRQKKKQ